MPIDAATAIGAPPHASEASWSVKDVQLYHLALGAGVPPTDPRELRYTYEQDLHVLPTFGVVVGGGIGYSLFDTPGLEIDLTAVLYGSQEIIVHRPLPTEATVTMTTRVPAIYDKGKAAVIVLEAVASTDREGPLFTQRSEMFIRGEGGFGGERGPSVQEEPPTRTPDREVDVATLPQQAQLYRLCGDINPLHIDPAFAGLAGFDRPILHGLCSYGIAAKAVVDHCLDGDVERIRGYRARFSGIFYPGETMRVSVWDDGAGRIVLTARALERDGAVVLSNGSLDYQP